MPASRLFPVGAALALAGLVLLVLETARALRGNTLSTLASVLLWVGVGLVLIGGALLVLTVARIARADSDGGQPADG